jgi:hypothetical protein
MKLRPPQQASALDIERAAIDLAIRNLLANSKLAIEISQENPNASIELPRSKFRDPIVLHIGQSGQHTFGRFASASGHDR